MTPTELIPAVHSGKRGDRVVYPRGIYASGEACAGEWKQYAKGKVLLVQKRVSPVWPQRWARYAFIAQVL